MLGCRPKLSTILPTSVRSLSIISCSSAVRINSASARALPRALSSSPSKWCAEYK